MVTHGWNRHPIRVSKQSCLQKRKFSCRSSQDSNSQLFDHESSALTNKLSQLLLHVDFECSMEEHINHINNTVSEKHKTLRFLQQKPEEQRGTNKRACLQIQVPGQTPAGAYKHHREILPDWRPSSIQQHTLSSTATATLQVLARC